MVGRGGFNMGKRSKFVKKERMAYGRFRKALNAIVGMTDRYYNDSKMLAICNIAKKALNKKCY